MDKNISYVVRDIAGSEVCRGVGVRVATDRVETTLKLPRGFHEIAFEAAPDRRFGLIALPASTSEPDPFFAIDGALSWLVKDDGMRDGLMAVARRSGLAMMRERLTWGAVHRPEGAFEWETPRHFDRLRRKAQRVGLPLLELAHDAPIGLGRIGKYPDDLVAAARSWAEIARHWNGAWGGVEAWNEPDIFFGGDLPADQYVPVVKALRAGLNAAGSRAPLVVGATAHFNESFLETAARNGLLACGDAFSFHTYDRAPAMESLVARYRGWLRENGRGGMPLWITECGRPWAKSGDRASIEQDAASAVDIVAKAVEARAAGVARYFAFVYPFYEENDSNFGMMDRLGTPMRAFAAYAQVIRMLSRSTYLGDLKAPGWGRPVRVFGRGDEAVAVVWTSTVDRAATARLEVEANALRGVEGIDGRALVVGPDGSVPVPDGLSYVVLDRNRVGPSIVRDTSPRALHADAPSTNSASVPEVILRARLDPTRFSNNSGGHRLLSSSTKPFPLVIEAFNLADEPSTVSVAGGIEDATELGLREVNLPARGRASATWTLDLSAPLARTDRVKVWFEARREAQALDRVAMVFEGETSIDQVLAAEPDAVRLPIGDQARWTVAADRESVVRLTRDEAMPWRLDVKHQAQGDHWAYPVFLLPDALALTQEDTLVVRARCERAGQVRLFLWEGQSGVGYITPRPVVPDDGKWHVTRIRVRDLVESRANAPDPDGKLDVGSVRRLSFGLNSKDDANTLDLSDLILVRAPARP
jgi:hypothetical protein